MKLSRISLTIVPLLVVLGICILLAGCIGATRLPVKNLGPAGDRILKGELDLTQLESASLQREEITEKFHQIDTGFRDPHLFWGRWAESKWGYWWIVASNYQAAGDAKRLWRTKNLLVTFDDNGAIKDKQLFDDDRVLWRQLHTTISVESPSDLSFPYLVTQEGEERTMTLRPNAIEILHPKKGPVLIAPGKLARFSHNRWLNQPGTPAVTCHVLHFSEKTTVGKSVSFCSYPNQVVALFRYLNQNAPKSMRWE